MISSGYSRIEYVFEKFPTHSILDTYKLKLAITEMITHFDDTIDIDFGIYNDEDTFLLKIYLNTTYQVIESIADKVSLLIKKHNFNIL